VPDQGAAPGQKWYATLGTKVGELIQLLFHITTRFPFLNAVWFVVVVVIAVAIARGLGLDERTTFLASAIAILLFVLVVVYKVIAGLARAKLALHALVLSWAAVILFLLFMAFLGSSVLFGWPLKLQRWLDASESVSFGQVLEEFAVTPCQKADDTNLPESLFGLPGDDLGMPRQWMRTMDAGALWKLKLNDEQEGKMFWLLTQKFPGNYRPFTAHVYAGTTQKVILSAFLVEPNGEVKLVALTRAQDLGVPGLYRFNVPLSREGNRLLVFLAMKQSSYNAIPGEKAFHIRSQPY
jgi:hypothetical protein